QVWQEDDYELVVVKESQFVQTDARMKLYKFQVDDSILVMAEDYRVWLRIDDTLMNPLIDGQEILTRQVAPPAPTRLRLTTAFEDTLRAVADDVAGYPSMRQAYILAKFGDTGTGTASGNTFTKSSSEFTWTTNEWAGQYMTDSTDRTYLVVSNTVDTLTFDADDAPASGAFTLGPAAAGYRFLLEPLDPTSGEPISYEHAESTFAASPVKMQQIWHGLTPAVNYRVRVCSMGDWFQSSASAWCTPVTAIAGGAKVIPASCADSLEAITTLAVDSGIKVSWSRVGAYAAEIAGVEVCWTDDGSTPSFTNLSHKHAFVTHDHVVLPVPFSTTAVPVTAKVALRCVDRAGRHCTTALALTPLTTKSTGLSIASMAAELVTARGDSASLAARLGSVSTLEDEVTSARLTYSSVSQAIQAVSRSGVLWGNVRIVAKTGGQYTTIQAAVTSVTGTDPCVILIMPGTYAEDVDVTDKVVDFVGLGKVVVEGHLHTSGDFMYVSLIENIRFINASPTEADPLLTLSGENGCHVRHCQFVYAGLADAVATTGNGKVFDACIFWGEPQGSSALLSVGHVGDAVDVVVKYCRFSTSASTKPCIKVVQTDKVCSLRLFHSTLKTVTSAAVVGSGTKADLILYHGHNAYNVAPDSGTLTIVVDTQDGTSSNSIFSDTNALPVIL
ncbi:MAG TPA: hypothetical protein VM243_03795, partial [Phycisphaerae bacterium]|nr:hypothetical protein [Phycisphaerae bacterium]